MTQARILKENKIVNRIMGSRVLDEAMNEDAPVDKHVHKQAWDYAKSAEMWVVKGMKYGPDMGSSALMCYQDAIERLQKAVDTLKKGGAKA